jgi:hypothetical protein
MDKNKCPKSKSLLPFGCKNLQIFEDFYGGIRNSLVLSLVFRILVFTPFYISNAEMIELMDVIDITLQTNPNSKPTKLQTNPNTK